MDNQELTHHGVKGMKWGVRKAQSDSPKTVSRSTSKVKDIIDATDYKVSDVYEVARRLR